MQQRRVLVIDDEEPIRCLMMNVFQSAGYAVELAGTGREAFEKLESKPDLVTVDLMMPDVTGWEIIEQVCARPNAPTVVVVSGRADVDGHPLRNCVAGVVHKPFMPRELLDICDTVLRGRKRSAAQTIERRRTPRRDFVMDVRVAPAVGNPMLNAKVVDLSPLGAEIELPTSMETDSVLRLAMRFPGQGRAVFVDGTIRYCAPRDGGWTCGLEFSNVTPQTRHELTTLLDMSAMMQ
jgi:DNA-binding response OmpR family regulator